MITKKVAGAGEVELVYGARNRLVMSQDSLLRAQQQWSVLIYDSLNRAVKTAVWTDANGRSYHQNLAQSSVSYPVLSGVYSVLTESFYDDYSWQSRGDININHPFTSNFNNNNDLPVIYTAAYPQTPAATTHTRGMPTGARVKVFDPANNNLYLLSTTFFDEYNRPVQAQVQNVTTGWDTLTTRYDFNGKILSTCQTHSLATVNGNIKWNKVVTAYNYDTQGRVTTTNKYLNGSTVPETIALATYDRLGRAKTKTLGSKPLETLNYDYTIRGWLKGINRAYANSGTGSYWFGEDISYDYGATKTQLNGNISAITWMSRGDAVSRAYGFDYDNINRLLKGDFTQNNAVIRLFLPSDEMNTSGSITKFSNGFSLQSIRNKKQTLVSFDGDHEMNEKRIDFIRGKPED